MFNFYFNSATVANPLHINCLKQSKNFYQISVYCCSSSSSSSSYSPLIQKEEVKIFLNENYFSVFWTLPFYHYCHRPHHRPHHHHHLTMTFVETVLSVYYQKPMISLPINYCCYLHYF